MNIYHPPIVVVTYNRPKSLARLLGSLSKAIFSSKVELIISIDNSGNDDVFKIAEEFNWEFGSKRIIKREVRMGLRKHILSCGDFSEEYGSVIVLEDDLVVSPFFYEYTQRTLDFYSEDSGIGGISLYTHNTNIHTKKPFIPLDDNTDVFFLQFPSSWGQAWTRGQWRMFKGWYAANEMISDSDPIPLNVKQWPDSSWLKHFTNYLVATNKLFVYPRISLTTNFSDVGEHIAVKKYEYQRALQVVKRDYRLISRDSAIAAYDVYFEILPDYLRRLTGMPELNDCTIDLYGIKEFRYIKTKYLLSTKICWNPIKNIGRNLRPVELNIIESVPGSSIFLGNADDFDVKTVSEFDDLNYHFAISLTDLMRFTYLKLKMEGLGKIRRRFKK